jgi:hypothetical protein
MIKSKTRKKQNEMFKCAVSKVQVEWYVITTKKSLQMEARTKILDRLAMSAFRHVLGRRQTRYNDVIEWLEARLKCVGAKDVKILNPIIGLVKREGLSASPGP